MTGPVVWPGGGETVRVSAPAKVNLALEVVGKRPDGYHELATIFQTIDLRDEVDVVLRAEPGIDLEVRYEGFDGFERGDGPERGEGDTSLPDLGPAERNLVVRAGAALLAAAGRTAGGAGWAGQTGQTGQTGQAGEAGEAARENAGRVGNRGARFRLTKRIPVGAGLGGGSSDAAAALVGLNHLLGDDGVSDADLHEIAASLGADVPFFLVGGTCLGRGIGELLTPLPSCPEISLVVVFPNVAVSTSSVFGRLESGLTPPGPLARMSPLDIRPDFWSRDWADFRNDLEPHVAVDGSAVAEVLRTFRSLGSSFSRMSGSGSAVFGVAPDEGQAREWMERFRAQGYWARAVRPTRAGCRLLKSGVD
ncbi:MAG: hypothetical protein R3E97_09320 [Candidatus Eisenbacteria bacterium]